METLEEIYDFIASRLQNIPTVYEDETHLYHGSIRTLDEDDMSKVFMAIENLVSG